jgi:hypothetical protein
MYWARDGTNGDVALDRAQQNGLPVICIDAMNARAALKMQINKEKPEKRTATHYGAAKR